MYCCACCVIVRAAHARRQPLLSACPLHMIAAPPPTFGHLQAVVQLSGLTKLDLSATGLHSVPAGPYLSTNLQASSGPGNPGLS